MSTCSLARNRKFNLRRQSFYNNRFKEHSVWTVKRTVLLLCQSSSHEGIWSLLLSHIGRCWPQTPRSGHKLRLTRLRVIFFENPPTRPIKHRRGDTHCPNRDDDNSSRFRRRRHTCYVRHDCVRVLRRACHTPSPHYSDRSRVWRVVERTHATSKLGEPSAEPHFPKKRPAKISG
jgi:hypothetical protein